MSLRTRALVFTTFFGSCLAVGLLLVSLTTNNWVRASPKRSNSLESSGEVYYGLFSGTKDLNAGIGLRSHAVNMYTFMQSEPEVMNFWLWLFTALGTGFGLLSSAIAAIASVLKAASASKKPGTMVILFASNITSVSAQVTAFVCWVVQFYNYLTTNVLASEDIKIHWYSNGLASFGYSFYLLVISSIVVLINVVILFYAHRSERRQKRRMEPPVDEKNQGGIMLY